MTVEEKITKQQIRAEFAKFQAADVLANAALMLYGALKATEIVQPRLVSACLPAFENAIKAWSEINERELETRPFDE